MTHFASWGSREGEEHIPSLLHNESPLVDKNDANLATDARVPGRIRGHQEVYRDLGADDYIVSTVENGYKLVFDSLPPDSFTRNNKSALEKKDFVYSELLRLEELGCIKRVNTQPRVVLPLSAVHSKKWRLVVDASRTLNPYCTKRKIMLEDLSHIPFNIRKGDYMVVNDLDSGYWHLPIAEEHWTYLGVHFEHEDGSYTFWVWTVLCLGLRDAAFIFTKTLSPLVAELRREGLRGQLYIDDKLTLGSTFHECMDWEQKVKALFYKAGWVFKPGKRSGEPSQVCRFLGLIIDSRDLTFNIPSEKMESIRSRAEEMLRRRLNKVKVVASLVGLLQSVRLATGPIVGVMTRSLYFAINDAKSWSSFVKLDDLAREELKWWSQNIEKVSKYPIQGSITSVPAGIRVASDSSGVGLFSYEVRGRPCLARRPFSAYERSQSSTYRELAAFFDTWTDPENLAYFEGKKIAHHTDNKAMVYIIAKGSRNRKLQPMIMGAVLKLREYNIEVEPVWVSRDNGIIKFADMGSRDFHADDISVDMETFQEAQEFFGAFTVDCFASAGNAKCERFFSRLDVPRSSGVDFFMQELDGRDNHWIFPPLGKLCQAVIHLKSQKVSGVVVVPVWPRSSFFSFFFPDGKHLASWVVSVKWTRPYFVCGPLVTSKFLRGWKSFDTALIKVDFKNFNESNFYTSKVGIMWCRSGGCEMCQVGKIC